MSYQCKLKRNLNVTHGRFKSQLTSSCKIPTHSSHWEIWRRLWWIVQATHHVTICHSGDSSFHLIASLTVTLVLRFDLIVASLAHRCGVSQVQSITFGRFFNHSLQKAFTTGYNSVLVINRLLGSWKTDLDHDMRSFQLMYFEATCGRKLLFDVCTSNKWQQSIRVMVMAQSNFNV